MNKIIKNTLILTIITVVSGLLLGIVYDITKEPIAAAQENSKQEAYRTVLPDAASFEDYEEFDPEDAAALIRDNGYTDDLTEVAAGKSDSGETVGYVLNVTSHSGYGGDIQIGYMVPPFDERTLELFDFLFIHEGRGEHVVFRAHCGTEPYHFTAIGAGTHHARRAIGNVRDGDDTSSD